MKNKIFANWGLKLGSVLMAFAIWFVVTNINDPDTTLKISNVKVKLLNTNIVTDNGQVYEILDETNIIDSVTIRAPRSIIDTLSDENVVATADFNELTASDTVPIRLSTNKYNAQLESITGNIDTLRLNVEDLKSKTLALSTVTSGTISEGYMVGDISADENQIRISGPESIIDQIVKAEANVSVTGFTQDIITDADISLLDSYGDKVVSGSLTTNMSKVKVKVEILQTKRIALSFTTSGTPAEGYEATGNISVDPDSILVAGKSSVLSYLEKLDIEDPINITGQSGDMQTLVDVSRYLPSYLKLADTTSGTTVTVTVSIEPLTSRTVTIPAGSIEWRNIPTGYEVSLSDPDASFIVALKGLRTRLEAIDPTKIVAVADLENILDQEDTVGENYHVTFDFEYEGSTLKTEVPVQVWFRLEER